MLKSKVFVKKTKKGSILKIVREHYLRDDICCGYEGCNSCEQESFPLLKSVVSRSKCVPEPHLLLPDTNVVLHQIDVLEDKTLENIIILQTVLEEVRHRSGPIYKRLKDVIDNPDRHCYVFVNEFHKDTYIERVAGESANDRNDRSIRHAAWWFNNHLQYSSPPRRVVLVTDDADNRKQAQEQGILAFGVSEYIESLEGCEELRDRIANREQHQIGFGDKVKYPEHLSLAELQRGIKSGKYKQGSFQASRDNYLEANCAVEGEEKWVFLQGAMNLNRAVNGDVVAVEMLPEKEWSHPSNMALVDRNEEEAEDVTEKDKELKQKTTPSAENLPTGRVVGIIRRKWRQYCGILQPSPVKTRLHHLFIPAEKRIPKIRIQTRQAEALTGMRIVVAIDSWPRHSRYPQGHFVRKLGEIGDKETENEVLLLEHDVPHSAFSEKVLACLPVMPWTITLEDRAKRADLRDLDICSVDPPGCTDIDDALHCRKLDNGNFEVGVHIADVSHFIRPGTAIDEEAKSRGTTVYLCDKRIDMVPELLSSNLCSLRSNVERFAFSVFWEMTDKAEVVSINYTKSIIFSKASLTYGEAQMMIDDKSKSDALTLGLRNLNRLAKILKQRRIDNGALTLASTEIRFEVDSETADPIDVKAKKLLETMSMVEEFMLLANTTVAEKITAEFPDCACLRRHPSPPASNFEPVIYAARVKGFELEVETGKKLAESLNKCVIEDNPYFNTLLRIMTTRCMMQAVYFSSGMVEKEDYRHYGLAAPIYTHYTSPIRRYSDIIVHRLLAVAIGADSTYPDLLLKRKTQDICLNLNYRHKMAQYAGRASTGLHTQLFFKTRVQDEDGYILMVRKNALQIMIPKYGLEGTIFLDQCGLEFTYDQETASQKCSTGQALQVFDPVRVQVSIDRSNVQHQKLQVKLVKPVIEGLSVPPAAVNQTTDDVTMAPEPKKKKQKTR